MNDYNRGYKKGRADERAETLELISNIRDRSGKDFPDIDNKKVRKFAIQMVNNTLEALQTVISKGDLA